MAAARPDRLRLADLPPRDVETALDCLEHAARDLDVADVPAFVGALERVKATAWARLVAGGGKSIPAPAEDRLLTAREVQQRTTFSVAWLYRHADTLPFAKRVGRKVLFSERRLGKWLAARTA